MLVLVLVKYCLIFATSYAANLQLSQEQLNLVQHLQESVRLGSELSSKLNSDVLQIDGMSSPKVRHFLNNVCSLDNTHYLEVGSYKGSTFMSAMLNNEKQVSSATAIDSWDDSFDPEGGIDMKAVQQEFYNNVLTLSSNKVSVCHGDSFAIDVSSCVNNKINIYMYDGDHSQLAQKQAFTYYHQAFADNLIVIVDDSLAPGVLEGTAEAFDELGYTILYQENLSAAFNGDIENWWNGLFVAVVATNSVIQESYNEFMVKFDYKLTNALSLHANVTTGVMMFYMIEPSYLEGHRNSGKPSYIERVRSIHVNYKDMMDSLLPTIPTVYQEAMVDTVCVLLVL